MSSSLPFPSSPHTRSLPQPLTNRDSPPYRDSPPCRRIRLCLRRRRPTRSRAGARRPRRTRTARSSRPTLTSCRVVCVCTWVFFFGEGMWRVWRSRQCARKATRQGVCCWAEGERIDWEMQKANAMRDKTTVSSMLLQHSKLVDFTPNLLYTDGTHTKTRGGVLPLLAIPICYH